MGRSITRNCFAKPGVVRLRHVLDMRVDGIIWALIIRLTIKGHDALIEDAFDRAEAYVASRPVSQRKWSFGVRLLRGILGLKNKS